MIQARALNTAAGDLCTAHADNRAWPFIILKPPSAADDVCMHTITKFGEVTIVHGASLAEFRTHVYWSL